MDCSPFCIRFNSPDNVPLSSDEIFNRLDLECSYGLDNVYIVLLGDIYFRSGSIGNKAVSEKPHTHIY